MISPQTNWLDAVTSINIVTHISHKNVGCTAIKICIVPEEARRINKRYRCLRGVK